MRPPPADNQDWIVWPDAEREMAWVGTLLKMEIAALTRFCDRVRQAHGERVKLRKGTPHSSD